MFGESESESPRVPSPWDSLISIPSPPGPVQIQRRTHTPSPLAAELIPRLVAESDDGNVEYKLQLLNPSPARFARLVTQMKWRLLEGGGQAYYELGVADSGDLIGLPREQLEQSLETLEMMAGEIGASIIVVKEIEVPAVLATLAKRTGDRRAHRREDIVSISFDGGYSTPIETETDPDSLSGTDVDVEDLSVTVTFEKDHISQAASYRKNSSDAGAIFFMDPELDDPGDTADDERLAPSHSYFSIDLEISTVYKPRPTRVRIPNHPVYAHSTGGKNKRVKKHKHLSMLNSSNLNPHGQTHQFASARAPGSKEANENNNGVNKRQGRDRRRDAKRKALEARAIQTVDSEGDESRRDTLKPAVATSLETETETLITDLEQLHVGLVEEPTHMDNISEAEILDIQSFANFNEGDDDIDDVISPRTSVPAAFPTFSPLTSGESHLDVDAAAIVDVLGVDGEKADPRLIVEVLVVRKMSLGEAFLDFGGFSLT